MSTTVQTNKVTFTGNGSTVDFAFTFKVFSASDLEVYLDGVLKTLTTHYTVAIDASVEGGTVTFVTAPAASVSVLIKRVLAYTQPSDLPTEGNFPEITVENALDRATMLIVQLKEILSRVPQLALDSEFSDLTLPEPSAGKVIGWNDAADDLENLTLEQTTVAYSGTISKGADAAKPASPTAGDVYFATDTNIIYRCNTSGTWTSSINRGAAQTIASATTCDIGAALSEYVSITGTTTITGLGTVTAGTQRRVNFTGILTLTHNSTSLILPGGASITTAAGDTADFISEGSGNWRCLKYQKANGKAVVETTEIPTPYTAAADTSTSDEATVSTSYVDSTLSIPFTVVNAGLCTANFTGRGDSSSGIAAIALVVDGTVVAEAPIPSGVAGCAISLPWSGQLAAGAHTIKVQQKGVGGGSCTLKGTVQTSRLDVNYPT